MSPIQSNQISKRSPFNDENTANTTQCRTPFDQASSTDSSQVHNSITLSTESTLSNSSDRTLRSQGLIDQLRAEQKKGSWLSLYSTVADCLAGTANFTRDAALITGSGVATVVAGPLAGASYRAGVGALSHTIEAGVNAQLDKDLPAMQMLKEQLVGDAKEALLTGACGYAGIGAGKLTGQLTGKFLNEKTAVGIGKLITAEAAATSSATVQNLAVVSERLAAGESISPQDLKAMEANYLSAFVTAGVSTKVGLSPVSSANSGLASKLGVSPVLRASDAIEAVVDTGLAIGQQLYVDGSVTLNETLLSGVGNVTNAYASSKRALASEPQKLVPQISNPYESIRSLEDIFTRAGVANWETIGFDATFEKVQKFLEENPGTPQQNLALAKLIAKNDSPHIAADLLSTLKIHDESDILDFLSSAVESKHSSWELDSLSHSLGKVGFNLDEITNRCKAQEVIDNKRHWKQFPLDDFEANFRQLKTPSELPKMLLDVSSLLVEDRTKKTVDGIPCYDAEQFVRNNKKHNSYFFLGEVEHNGVAYQVVSRNSEAFLNDFKSYLTQGRFSKVVEDVTLAADRQYHFGESAPGLRLLNDENYDPNEPRSDISISLGTGSNLPIKNIRTDPRSINATSWGRGTYLAPDIAKDYARKHLKNGFLMNVEINVHPSKIIDSYKPIGADLAKRLSEKCGQSIDPTKSHRELIKGLVREQFEEVMDEAGIQAVYVPFHCVLVRDSAIMKVQQVSRYLPENDPRNSINDRKGVLLSPDMLSQQYYEHLCKESIEPRRAILERVGFKVDNLDNQAIIDLYDQPIVGHHLRRELLDTKIKGSDPSVKDFVDALDRLISAVETGDLKMSRNYNELYSLNQLRADIDQIRTQGLKNANVFDGFHVKPVFHAIGLWDVPDSVRKDMNFISSTLSTNGFFHDYVRPLNIPKGIHPDDLKVLTEDPSKRLTNYLRVRGISFEDLYLDAYH